jgi:pimeloyl-ACP methyl ester carboxylesterase
MGAQLALHYAAAHPSKVKGLILIDPTLPKKLKGWLAIARRLRYPLWFVIAVMRLSYKLVNRHKTYPNRDLHALDMKTRKLMARESRDIIADLYSSPKEDLKYMPLVNYLQDIYASTGRLPDLSKIHCPVKVLLSKDSSIVDTANIKDYFSPDIPLEISEINANHWPLTEKPEETQRMIDGWCLNQLASDTP